MKRSMTKLMITSAAVLMTGSLAFGQSTSPNNNPPSNERPRRVEGQGGDRATRDRWNADRDELTAERLHSLLERRLERMSAQEERMRRVIELLDEGASIDDLRDEYRDLLFERDGRANPPDALDHTGFGEQQMPGGEPGAPEGDGRSFRNRVRDRITDEDRAKFMAFLGEEFPEIHERVLEVAPDAANGGAADIDPRLMRRILPLVEMMRLKERDPEMYAIRKELWTTDRQAWELARRVRDASDGDRPAAAEELHEVLGKQFDLQLRAHQLELDRLEARIVNARREAADQASHRDDLIKERLMDILSRQDAPDEGDRRGPRREDRRPAP